MADNVLQSALSLFSGFCLNDDGTRAKSGQLISRPEWLLIHIAQLVWQARVRLRPLVWLARIHPLYHWLAHPAKFPDAVKSACGIYPDLPEHLANLMRDAMLTAENDMEAVQALLRAERR